MASKEVRLNKVTKVRPYSSWYLIRRGRHQSSFALCVCHTSTQHKDSHLQATKRALTRNLISWHLNLVTEHLGGGSRYIITGRVPPFLSLGVPPHTY